MSRIRGPRAPDGFGPSEGESPLPGGQPLVPPWRRWSPVKVAVTAVLAAMFAYSVYLWEVRRVVVPQGHVLVLMKKNGSRSPGGGQFIIPRQPPAGGPEHARWRQEYADANGILEEVYKEGTYFRFSPFDFERHIIDLRATNAIVPNGKVGVVIRKFGAPLEGPRLEGRLHPGQGLADPARPQVGPLPGPLPPGTYIEYANPFAYEIKLVDPIDIPPGHRGVVTSMAGQAPRNPNDYLVAAGERGVQAAFEPEGFRYANPYEKRITPVSIQSHRFEMSGADIIRFPSSDSFDIQLEGFVEWSIVPDKLPLIYVQYAEGGGLVHFLESQVILPYARSFCRLVGSQYDARDFISGDTKLKFQQEFERQLKAECRKQGIEILQALVRDIVPPREIKEPINEREVARQQIRSLEQQIQVARSRSELVTQEQMGEQNKQTGDASKQAVTIVKKAQQEKDVAITQARQRLAVAKLRLQAAEKEAEALLARGQADAAVILLEKKAEAEPLRQQVQAFGDGQAFAQCLFYQKLAPSVKSILGDTDGAFGQMFRQFLPPRPATQPGAATSVMEVQP